ncbi:unnamed protein product, partial [Prorocentrum cordatum]
PPRTLLPSHIHSPMALNSFTTAARARPRRESEIRRLYNDQRWDATARQSRSQNYKRLWGRRGPLVRSACTSGGQEERERSRNEAEETDAEGMEAEEAPSKAPPLLRVRRYCSLTSADGLEGTRLGRAVCR